MKKLFASLTCGVFVALASVCAHAQIIYDNGGPQNGASGNEATAWFQAEDFVLGSSQTIFGAGVFVGDFSGAIDDWDALGNPLQWAIFGDSGGQPGAAPLASGNVLGLTVSDTGVPWCCGGNSYEARFFLDAPFAASANTTYYFGIHLDNDYTNREDVYFVTTDPNNTVTGWESSGGTFDNWNNNGQEHAFYLIGIPEPSTVGICAIGMVGLMMSRRRRV